MSSLFDFPTTRQQAKAKGRTYFYSNRECPVHKSRFHWTHNGQSMSCVDYNNERIPVLEVAFRRAKPGAPFQESRI